MNIRTGKRLVFAAVLAASLSVGSIAVADIISGLSTTNSSTNVTITNLTLAKPSDVAQGDFMLASIALHDGNAVSATPPTGWTQVLRTDNETNIGIVSYWKFASASEPSNYTWVLSPQTRAQGTITRYSGVDTSNPIDAAAGNIGRSKIATTSPITTTLANDVVVSVYALHVGNNTFAGDFFSTPAGMTQKVDASYTNAGPTIASFDMTQVTAGASGSKSSTISGNPNQQRDWASQHIALRARPPYPVDDFNSAATGNLTGQNSGSNWTSPWFGGNVFDVQTGVVYEGSKAAHFVAQNTPADQITYRTFAPMGAGTLHFAMRKDEGNQVASVALYSGETVIGFAAIGSDTQQGLSWLTRHGVTEVTLQPYTLGSFDTVDMQFDTATDMYRISLNGGAYSPWITFMNDVDTGPVDKIEISGGGSGFTPADVYIDDMRINP